jgi:hypothetical protein
MSVRTRMTQAAIDAVNAEHERRREALEPDALTPEERAQDGAASDYYRDEQEYP